MINDVTSFGYPINIQTCSANVDETDKRNVFVVVVSAPSYFEKRHAIRRSWERDLKNEAIRHSVNLVGFVFILGRTDMGVEANIEKEYRKHGDVIQVDISDTYNNLSLKSVSILNWVFTFCPRVDFLLKVDDDVYVNVRNLVATIRDLSLSDLSVYGKSAGGKW